MATVRVLFIVRHLWRLRLMVAVVGVAALLAGMATVYRVGVPPQLEPRQHVLGVASASSLIDTPSSQIVDLGTSGGTDVTTLPARASLLASLMTSSPMKEEIARRAEIAPSTFVAVPPPSGGPAPSPAPSVPDAAVGASDPRANILRASVVALPSGQMPIIAVEAQSPNAAVAGRVADAAMLVLRAHVRAVAGQDRVPPARQLVVRRLGAAQHSALRRGPGPTRWLIVAVIVFGVGCGLVVGVSWLASAWHGAPSREREVADDHWSRDGDAWDTALVAGRRRLGHRR